MIYDKDLDPNFLKKKKKKLILLICFLNNNSMNLHYISHLIQFSFNKKLSKIFKNKFNLFCVVNWIEKFVTN